MSTPTRRRRFPLVHAHDDAIGIDIVDHAAAQRCTVVPESTATVSRPRCRRTFSGRRQGTAGAACSSHQRAVGVIVLEDGISDAARKRSGRRTSMKSTRSGLISTNSPLSRQLTSSSWKRPVLSSARWPAR